MTHDKEKLLALADAVARGTRPFDMRHHETCIISYVRDLFVPGVSVSALNTEEWGSRLGLNYEESYALFIDAPDENNIGLAYRVVDRERAVSAIRRLAETGKVVF